MSSNNNLMLYLTPAELEMVKLRAKVHRLLQKDLSVREIARFAKVSTTTVINIKKYLNWHINKKTNHVKNRQPRIPWKLGRT